MKKKLHIMHCTGTAINPLFITYSLNNHFRTKYCPQDLKFVSPRIKILVRILIFNFNLHIEFEKLVATESPRGSRERFLGHSLTTGISANAQEGLQSFLLTARASEIQGAFMYVPCLLFS